VWQRIEVRELEVNSQENHFLDSLGFQLNFFAALSHICNLSLLLMEGAEEHLA